MESVLKGHRFVTVNAIKENSLSILRGITSDEFSGCFRNWEKRMKRCIDSLGQYLRNINNISCWSNNKVNGVCAEPGINVTAVAGTRASLPCDLTPRHTDDRPLLVLWYREDWTTPIYSVDGRRGPITEARHAATDHLAGRAYFNLAPSPALLSVDYLRLEDEGEYRCRVDFRKDRSRNKVVFLNIIGCEEFKLFQLHIVKVANMLYWTKIQAKLKRSSLGVIYYELLQPNETITGERYQQQLMRLSRALKIKRPLYAKRHDKVIYQHDNARRHVAKVVKETLEALQWDVLPHPLYSPDIAPSDYHLFRSMTHGLAEQHFTSYEEAKNWVNVWIASKDEEFFRHGIRMLPERWEKVVAKDGQYFE
ncbi:hypothetical protein LAZ67_2002436 [Cordylochernes scorpioides]|uniref:Ig-like domain-containing protein n=1 Tax=Cordylochernes scorpioides TaxID=51811 RepID=A0ABY6K5I0_9ARAC|nr:hypothetical protein LAZ67_2002436 [Cordylochernes scorpioides]